MWWILITESEKFDILFVKHKNLLNEYAVFSLHFYFTITQL